MLVTSMRGARGWVVGLALCSAIGCDAAAEPQAAKLTTSGIVITPPHVINADAPIPANGGLLIGGLFSDPGITVTVTSSNDPGAPPIAGSVHSLFHYEVWVGDAPLPPGAYSVASTSNVAGSGTSTIQIVEPRTPQRPALESSAILNIARDVPVIDCCWSLTDRIPPLLSCFPIQTVDHASLAVTLTTSEPPSALTQLLFRVSVLGDDRANPVPLADQPGFVAFPAQAESYCYEVEACEITTGASYVFDGAELCVPHGNEAPLHMQAVAVDSARLDRAVCPAPPANLNDAWCAHNLAACEGEAAGTTACSFAGHVCRGEPRPAGMIYDPSGNDDAEAGAGGEAAGGANGMSSGGASGDGGASGTSSSGASGAPGRPSGNGSDAGDEESEATKRAYGCGCRIVRVRPSDPGTWLAALGVLTALTARRIRRRVVP